MNVYEPQDLSIRGFAPPNLLGSTMQIPPVTSDSDPLVSMLSDPIGLMFLQLLQQLQTVQQQETLPCTVPDRRELENAIQRTVQEHLPCKKSKFSIHGELQITVDSKAPATVKINSSSHSASKRKSYMPVRMLHTPSSLTDYVNTHSEALDLSPSGSAHSNDSSPVTPVKSDFTSAFNNQYERKDAPGKIISFAKRRISVGRRNFPCNQCNQMEFYSLQQLEEHTRVSHGSYRCHICSRTFTQRSNLQRHALKHVGFKPFQCALCLQGYYRKDHLMRHMEVNHPAVNPRENIKVFLSSSKSLEYLNTTQSAISSISSLLPIGPEQLKFEKAVDRKSRESC
ncbi:unnamed protein product [Rodentolepis nana]|uniref:Zinc finger protein n=1 Tax=Rodentolepis nana TaxID=102285 RepID=A0A0R3T6D1_RODNA|nr:unnamed protein product [Rodentolepis nana]